MKRNISIMLIISMLLSCCALPTFAVNLEQDLIATEEELAVDCAMTLRKINGNDLDVEVLYDATHAPSFLLGTSENGYIILERSTMRFLEGGEQNPYSGYQNQNKYYGGFTYYYVDVGESKQHSRNTASFYDIWRNDYSSSISQVERTNNNVQTASYSIATLTDYGSLVEEDIVTNATNYIKRRAHGYNDDDTCSAVAVGIVLNYLTYKTGIAFVPTSWRSEFLSTIPSSSSNMASNYPKAHALHRYLVDTCGMEPTAVGQSIKVPLNTYVANKAPSSNLSLSWTAFPNFSTIKSNIQNDIPVVITTTILAGEYNFHSMAVYGYREYVFGNELLVHTGWYSNTSNNNGQPIQAETWISFDHATFAHYFDY